MGKGRAGYLVCWFSIRLWPTRYMRQKVLWADGQTGRGEAVGNSYRQRRGSQRDLTVSENKTRLCVVERCQV